jgi:L-asparaginase
VQVVNEKKLQQWVVLGTGGTIAGTAQSASDHTGYTAEALGGDVLLGEQVAQLDSKDMDHATWQALALRCSHWLAQPEVGGIVVTHGTDTLEETAWFLQLVLDTRKPVVRTCAMRPATALAPDGPQNVLDALAVVRDPQASGVLAVCAGRIHRARDVQKVHPYRLDAFSSGDAGVCGWVEQAQVRWAHGGGDARGDATPAHPQAERALAQAVSDWPWVEVVFSHAGADARRVQALVAAGVQGLVVAGTGNGTVHHSLQTALSLAQSRGVVVRRVSRCAEGQLVGAVQTSDAQPLGLTAFKARVSLMLDLM